MIFTISLSRGAQCFAWTITNAISLWDAVLQCAEDNSGWEIDTIKEGW
jgi:hypothetical protein